MKDLDIKDIWKGGDAEDQGVYNKPDIDKMIKKGSQNIVHRFVRTLVWEQWINVVVLTSLVVELFWAAEWLIGSCTLVINFVFFFYYQRLKKSIREEHIDSHVLDYLKRVQVIIRQFIKHLKIASILILIVAVFAAYYLNQNGFYEEIMDTQSFIISLGASMSVALPVAFYLIHLMYGRKSIKLAQMIASLESEEDEN